MAAAKRTYEEAMKKLEQIVAQMGNNELDIDSLTAKLKEARSLITFCKEKLYKTEEEVRKIMDDENA